jgi:ssDNA-binding replication factor A large subunit
MKVEEIVHAILCKHPELNRAIILETLETEKSITGGLIADDTLMRLIGARYDVQVAQNKTFSCSISTGLLVPALNDVTISGRIVAVYPVKCFEGKQPGKYASLLIADKDGLLRVMLWNDKASIVESGELKTGQVARFSHGYTREDRDGKIELHLGAKSRLEITPKDVQEEDFPSIKKFVTKIVEIPKAQQNLHLVGVVREVFASSTFTRQDNTVGKILRFTIADKTGDTVVVAWNEKAEKLETTLKSDMQVKLVNAKIKTGSKGGFEVHVDDFTYVDVSAVAEQP